MKIRSKNIILSVLIAVVVIASVVILAVVYGIVMRRNVENDISQNLNAVAAQSASVLRERIRGDQQILNALANLLNEKDTALPNEKMLNILKNRTSSSNFEEISFASLQGDVFSWDGTVRANIAVEPSFQEALKGKNIIDTMQGDFPAEGEIIVMMEPVYRDNVVQGLILGWYSPGQIDEILTVNIFGEHGFSYLAHSNGDVFIHSHHPAADKDFNHILEDFSNSQFDNGPVDLSSVIQSMEQGGNGEIFYTWKNSHRIMNYMPVGISDWYLLSVVPRDVIETKMVPLVQQAMALIAAILIILLLAFLFVFYKQRKSQQKLRSAYRELTALYHAIPGGVFRCKNDADWTVTFANDSFYRFLGYTESVFREKHQNRMASIVYPADLEAIRQVVSEQLQNGKTTVIHENRLVCQDGSVKWIWINAELMKDDEEEESLYCTFVDISRLKETQEELKLNQQRFEIILDQSQDTIFEWNLWDKTIYHSKNFVKKFGYDPVQKNFPQSLLDRQIVADEDTERFLKWFSQLEQGKPYVEGELRVRKKDGSYIWCKMAATTIFDESKHPVKVVGILADINEQKKQLERISEFARLDPLTQLCNRRVTEQEIGDYLEAKDGAGILFLIDIDNFKGINDTQGHLYGDQVLREISQALKGCVSSADIAGRIGGDEFLVFHRQENADDIGVQAQEKAKEIVRIFQSLSSNQGTDFQITGSVGISLYPRDGTQYAELFEKADIALYYAKEHGKNQYACYSAQLAQKGMLQDVEKTLAGTAKPENTDQENRLTGMGEYIFKILFESSNVSETIPILFDLIGKTLAISRIYIYEFSEDQNWLHNTFAWKQEGVKPREKQEKKIPVGDWKQESRVFDERYVLYCDDTREDFGGETIRRLVSSDACSTLLCYLQEHDKPKALVGFEQCDQKKYPTKKEIETISLLSKIISTFLLRDREQEHMITAFLNCFHCCAYIIDVKTHALLFMNKQGVRRFPCYRPGSFCYEILRGYSEPCPDCPIREEKGQKDSKRKTLYYAPSNDWSETEFTFFSWKNKIDACLICCNDQNPGEEKPASHSPFDKKGGTARE